MFVSSEMRGHSSCVTIHRDCLVEGQSVHTLQQCLQVTPMRLHVFIFPYVV
jgi:hypothetical protein